MDHIARPQSSVLTTPASSLTDTDTAQLALVQTLSQATRPSSAARAETDCRRMESLVPAQGRLLRLDPALDPALYHALDPALDHAVTGAAALDLAPVFRAADLTAVASSLQHQSPCHDLATAACSPPRRRVSSQLATSPHHIASIASGRHTPLQLCWCIATTLPDLDGGKVQLAAVCQLLNSTLLSTSTVFV